MRVDQPPAGWHIVKPRDAEGGTTFRRDEDRAARDWPELHDKYVRQITEERRAELAGQLGVSTSSLDALECGWTGHVWTIPERNAAGEIIGICTRDGAGAKKSMKGGRRGLTIPRNLAADGIVVCAEGPSDVAALLTLGIASIGRPSASGGVKFLDTALRGRVALILGEHDRKSNGDHPGKKGAMSVARQLAAHWRGPVRWALPPDGAKDVRAWLLQKGIDLADAEGCRAAGRELLEELNAASATIDPPADDAIKSDTGDGEGEPKKSQATALVELAAEVELFHCGEDAYATLIVDEHREHWPVRSKAFRRWLARQYFRAEGRACGSQAIADAITVIEGQALFDCPDQKVFVRLAEHDGNIYLDLCDECWRAVEVTPTGWRVVEQPPVKFRRAKAMRGLPEPVSSGSIDDLRDFLNLPDKDDTVFILIVAWAIGALRPDRPAPVLSVGGEQGSAKSTVSRLLRSLIDPNTAPLRCEPRDERDLMIAANNSLIMAYDNVSHLPPWLSDALCRLSTGGGFGTRTLYENDEETIFDSLRPVLVNGIEEIATRSDLLDRTIRVILPAIPEDRRRTESELWRAFRSAQPRILGALLDVVSCALRNIGSVKLASIPRMADFAEWVVAAEPALPWQPGAFMAAYSDNRASANELAIEASAIAAPMRLFAQSTGSWSGTATALLDELDKCVDQRTRERQDWPRKPNSLSNALKRIAPNLRKLGIEVEFGRDTGRTRQRFITIRTVPQEIVQTVRDRPNPESCGHDGKLADDGRTMAGRSSDDHTPAKLPVQDDADDADGEMRSPSNSGDREEIAL